MGFKSHKKKSRTERSPDLEDEERALALSDNNCLKLEIFFFLSTYTIFGQTGLKAYCYNFLIKTIYFKTQ